MSSIALKHHPVVYMYGHPSTVVTKVPVDLDEENAVAKTSKQRHEVYKEILAMQTRDGQAKITPQTGYILFRDTVYQVCPSSRDMRSISGPRAGVIKKILQAAI